MSMENDNALNAIKLALKVVHGFDKAARTALFVELGQVEALISELQSIPPYRRCEGYERDLAALQRRENTLADTLRNWADLRHQALRHLRELNGVTTVRFVDDAICDVVVARVEQGFRNCDVALMVGVTPSTVSAIKLGRYRLASGQRPRIGDRGRFERLF
jgi:DNA-binding XRE family transcriptional regulator